jgi:Zn-dependent protease with chaperone function
MARPNFSVLIFPFKGVRMIAAIYFDGISGKRHPVHVKVANDQIHVVGADVCCSVATNSARLGEPFAHAPCVVGLADGSRLEVHEPVARQSLLRALKFKESLVMRWQNKWLGALVAIIFMLCALFSAYYWGVPWAAARGSVYVPYEIEKKLGDQELAALDKGLFKPTELSAARQQRAQEIFQRIMPTSPRIPMTLVFRSSKVVGPNAFALPNGTIVVTDEMITHITGSGSELTGGLEDELAGVLAHEIGHVQGRHSVQMLIAGSIVGACTWTLFGDFSAVAAGAPAYILHLEYSRSMETAADDYAVTLLKQHHIPASRLAELFESLETLNASGKRALKLPNWMRVATGYMSTHPATEERIARLKQADQH